MKQGNRGVKVVSIVGMLWCFCSTILSLITFNNYGNSNWQNLGIFFTGLCVMAIPGTILLLIATFELSKSKVTDNKEYASEDKLNNYRIITLSFVNIPAIIFLIYSVFNSIDNNTVLNDNGNIFYIKLTVLLILLVIIIAKFISMIRYDK